MPPPPIRPRLHGVAIPHRQRQGRGPVAGAAAGAFAGYFGSRRGAVARQRFRHGRRPRKFTRASTNSRQSSREVLVLRFLEDMTYEQIAKVTGCPIGQRSGRGCTRQVGPAPGDRTQEIDMNAKHEQSAEKKALVDALLAIDSRMPSPPNGGAGSRPERPLRYDRRRVRILMWMTIGFFLLTVMGICFSYIFTTRRSCPKWNIPARHPRCMEQQLPSGNRNPPSRICWPRPHEYGQGKARHCFKDSSCTSSG